MNGLVFLALLSTMCFHLASAAWSQSHRNHILKIHNDYRRGIKDACDMTDLTYDIQIENAAKNWATKCVFEHEKKGYGENIAWMTKYGQEPELLTKLAKMWYDEVSSYRYGMYGCGAACHYTQLIWANTKKVGCYAADCSELKLGGRNAYYLVCFYSPPGNYMGEQPYKTKCDGKSKTPTTNNNNNNNNKITNNNNNNNNNNNGDGWETGTDTDGWEPWTGNNNNNNQGWKWNTGNTNNNNNNNNAGWNWNTGNTGNEWDWKTETGDNDGWNVVKKTGTNGNGGTWTVWTGKKTYTSG